LRIGSGMMLDNTVLSAVEKAFQSAQKM